MADLNISQDLQANDLEISAARQREHHFRKQPEGMGDLDALLTAEDVARRLNVSNDWVWDHSSRRRPYLPVIRMGDGTLRYRRSQIEEFVNERERLSSMRLKRA